MTEKKQTSAKLFTSKPINPYPTPPPKSTLTHTGYQQLQAAQRPKAACDDTTVENKKETVISTQPKIKYPCIHKTHVRYNSIVFS